MQDYEKLLEQGIKELPENVQKTERFEIPKVKGFLEGNKTVITNFKEVVDTLRRDAQHFLKYLLKELATPGNVDGNRLILKRKVSSSMINQKVKQYAENFVLCKTCGKPDTQINTKGGVSTLKCQACGAENKIKN